MQRKRVKKIADKAIETALNLAFPARADVSEYDVRNVQIPATGGGGIPHPFARDAENVAGMPTGVSGDGEGKSIEELPIDRLQKYPFLRVMSSDPTIDSAIKMHLSHAFSANETTGDIVRIESVADEHNEIVTDLQNALKDIINENIQRWAFPAAVYGVNYARVYGKQGVGIVNIRDDFYTNPEFIKEYSQGGQLAGFTAAYNGGQDEVRLLEPWKMVSFKTPYYNNNTRIEPERIGGDEVNLYNDDYSAESLVESEDYGTSLIETAYSPWRDLQEGILSMNMSRKNASKIERLIGVQMGKLNPQQAAKYLNTIGGQMKGAQRKIARDSLRRGHVQTQYNTLLPILGEHGGLDINTIEGTPDIQALEDIYFNIKRVGSGIGVDPALLGFGDLLAGGLGDGGFFRTSIIASIKSHMLRKALKNAIERFCEIHVAYKYGKFFLPGTKPWRIVFESVSSAMEQEAQSNMESRVNLATAMGILVQTLDPDMVSVDKHKLENHLFTTILKMDEESFKEIFPEDLIKKAQGAAEEGSDMGADAIFESAKASSDLKSFVYEIIAEVME